MESIWEKTCRGPARPPLYGKAQADVAVIGGGMTGILTALELQERGLQVVVAEAGHVGGGQTGRTTAKLTAQHGAIYAGLIERLGREKAAMYARANRRAVERCCARIELEHIDCDLERTDSWLYSYDREDALLREAEAERALGLDASFEPDTPLPLRVCGGVRLRGQAQFHPLKFLQALADRLTIYERTPVEHVESGTLFTPRGTIEAGRVVFASHYPFVNVPGLYFARMHQERSYAIALENAVLPAGMYYGLEPNAWSLRSYRGTVILSGGAHRTGRNGGGHYAALREAAQALFPGSREAAHWSAQDCMTASGVPYIGRFSARDPQWYVATGFRKWGMSNAMAAAELLTALICDGSHPDAAVFDPGDLLQQRPGRIAEEGLQAARGLGRRVLHGPAPQADELAVGEGGPAELDGKQMGVYRAAEELYYAVELRCPHLGCRLEWNPDDKSWDCPCHGSRFDVQGRCLTEPAQTDLPACCRRRS